MNKLILVTGGAGYIGSHCVLSLLKEGHDIIVFDNLSTGHVETVNTLKMNGNVIFYKGDLLDFEYLKSIFKHSQIDSVIHFAAFSQVGESMENPEKYYLNNVCGTLNLLRAMVEFGIKKLVFSSSAAIYGEPNYIPLDEEHPQNPINPYGKTKLMMEKIMDDYDKAYGLRSVRLRYFNAAGADSENRVGEWHNNETHLIPNILKSCCSEEKIFELYGTDYETKDGTCVRDYINVEDIAKAHVLALEYLHNGGKTDYFNIGTSEGYSVKEIFETCEKITQKKINIKKAPRRQGDCAILIADNSKAEKILNFKPVKTLEQTVKSALNWETKRLLNKK